MDSSISPQSTSHNHRAQTAAQEEFDSFLNSNSALEKSYHHPADSRDYAHDKENIDVSEEDEYHQQRIDDAMRMPSLNDSSARFPQPLRLPPRDFDLGRTTGVKGVIADARSYEEARRNGNWRKSSSVSRSRGTSSNAGHVDKRASSATFLMDDGEGSDTEEEEFLERWRQQRREELMREGNDIRNRRTSPSVRRYGRFDEVDALGYLDAIEKVRRETVVVVFVYDPECPVSQIISDALAPLVPAHPSIHFVRVHYSEIEFDPAGVPAVLAYKNQGELFANLTYIIDQIPEDTNFDTSTLEGIFRKNGVL